MNGANKKELTLNMLLALENIVPNEVMLIRHTKDYSKSASQGSRQFFECFNMGYECIKEYTSIQKTDFASGKKYWAIFIGDKGTTARYYCTFRVVGKKALDKSQMSQNFPCPEMYDDDKASKFIFEETDIMEDYRERLIIEWGKSTLQWAQNAEKTDKRIAAITSPVFPGYENLILTFGRLTDIINAPNRFSSYHEAMRKVQAVYLITDTSTGKMYVGSATGKDGLWGRWSDYAKTRDGGNEVLKSYLAQNPKAYTHFQYCVLQIFSMHTPKNDVIAAEYLYKRKLLISKFGMK